MRKKLSRILRTLVLTAVMLSVAAMAAFAQELSYTYELPEGIQVCDVDGNNVPSSEEMGDNAPWRVLDNIIYIRSSGLFIKGETDTDTFVNVSKCNKITLDGLRGQINLESYPQNPKTLEIAVKGENDIKNIASIDTNVVINGSGTLNAESIISNAAPLILDGANISIVNNSNDPVVYVLGGTVIYISDSTVEVNCTGEGVPAANGTIMLSECTIQGKISPDDASWQPADMRPDGNGRTKFYIGDQECQCYKLTPDRPHIHIPEPVAGKEPTCEKSGWEAAYKCSDDNCGLYFSDPACTEEIGDSTAYDTWKNGDGRLAATGHAQIMIPQQDATEAKDGVIAYFVCKKCNGCFEDSACETAITDIDTWKQGAGKIAKHTHSYGDATYIWNKDISKCTAYHTCTIDGCGHIELETVDTVEEADKFTATFTKAGFVKQEKDKPVPAHEHSFATAWSRNSGYHWHAATCEHSDMTSGHAKHSYSTSISKGVKTYTCKTCGYEKKETLTVAVPKPSIKSLTKAKKAFTVKWTKKSVTGYQIQYATNSKFTKGKKTIKVTRASTVSKKVSKLKAKKKYYVKVRCYTNKYGKTYYSKWSTRKAVTTK